MKPKHEKKIGYIKKIDVTGGKCIFYLYNADESIEVECQFPLKFIGQVSRSLFDEIEVTGNFDYKKGAINPHFANVEKIRTIRTSSQYMLEKSMFYVPCNIDTHGLPSEEYVARLRRGTI